jgi:phosphoribosylformylglycinamidine (FGAM) synthase PurS component
MEEELDSVYKNETWVLVDKPNDQKIVDCKWFFKLEEGIQGVEAPRYKARLVARGFTQVAGVDYNKIYSLVVNHASMMPILALTASNDFELEQLDVKTAFLHGNFKEKIYMKQPLGFEEVGQKDKFCLLYRSMYGLKQSPRQWYKRFDEYMISNGFSRSNYDNCVYFREYNSGLYVYLLLYVNEMLVACKYKHVIEITKQLLMQDFKMKDLGAAKKTLGMEIHRDISLKVLRLTQGSYIKKMLCNFGTESCKPVMTPMAQHFKLSNLDSPKTDDEVAYMNKVPYANSVGSLMYLMVCTRPDVGYVVSVVSRYLANPGKNHWEAVKWIFLIFEWYKGLWVDIWLEQ